MEFIEYVQVSKSIFPAKPDRLHTKIRAFPLLMLCSLLLFLPVSSFGYILGIAYNAATQQNEARIVNPMTGLSSLLSSFAFSTGFWQGHLVVDVAANRFYAISGDYKLYNFDLATGVILSTPTLDTQLQTFELGKNGALLGIAYNAATQQNEARIVNPMTGSSSLLSSFAFSTGFWQGHLVVDMAANRFYAVSGDYKLYNFDLATGIILSTPTLDTQLQTFQVVSTSVDCDIQLNKTTFINGDQVIAQVARLANTGSNPVPVEVKLWFEVPGSPPVPFLTVGADGSFVLAPGFNTDFGPLPLATVQAAYPRGQYSFNCRLLHAVTGTPLAEDFNPFQLQ